MELLIVFQDGPFDEARAVASFVKYFREKSGNQWADRHNFVNKPKQCVAC